LTLDVGRVKKDFPILERDMAGHRLVFERDFGDRSAIFTITPGGTDLRRLTTGPHFDVGPTYSPDAHLIAFGSDRGDILDNLWVMDQDGANRHQLADLGLSEAFPDWQAAQISAPSGRGLDP